MQSIWTTTLQKGDIIKIPQNTFLLATKGVKGMITSKPLYGLLVENVISDDSQLCEIMIDGDSWNVDRNNIYPGS